MEERDKYVSHALDFTKGKIEKRIQKNEEDAFPAVLDLSVHNVEPRGSSHVQERAFSFQHNIRTSLLREQFPEDDDAAVAQDLRVANCSHMMNFQEAYPIKNRHEKSNLNDGHTRQHRPVTEVFERNDSGYGILHPTLLDKSLKKTMETENALLSFNFSKTVGSHADDVLNQSTAPTAVSRNSAVVLDEYLASTETTGCSSFELDRQNECQTTAAKQKTTTHYCSESAMSEMVQSSFGVLPQSEDSQGKRRYDEYARQFADFLKSTASIQKTEHDSMSNSEVSEESQASEALSLNIVAEESILPDADVTSVTEKEMAGLDCEEGSQDAEETGEVHMNLEDMNEESLLDAKSESTKATEADETADGTTLTETSEKKKRKVKEVENSESQSSKPKRRKTAQPQPSENDAPVESASTVNVFEYQWPQEKNADWFVLQEHISEFLGVLSFKRKYPDIFRRPVDISERNFLRERGVVTEMQCDLGLTALRTEDICDLMLRDYPEKYQEYTKLLSKRQKITEPSKVHETVNIEKNKMESQLKKSIQAAADYNASLMRELRHERRAYFDLQTFEVHYPCNAIQSAPSGSTRMGSYPLALLPGQYQDYYKRYTQKELNYFPINTALYSPHKMLKSIFTDPNSTVVEDTEDDDGPEDANDHISISQKEKREEKNGGENVDAEKQKSSLAVSVDPEDSLGLLDDSAENSQSSFLTKTPLSTRRMPRLSAKKKGREVTQKCGVCNLVEKSKDGEAEDLVQCSECASTGHPSCLELTKEMVAVIKTYPWQCMECKTCVKCMDPHDEEKMMFCDHCDRGYHTFCVGLRSIPEGRWECPSCRDVALPPKPKRGRPFKYPRPQQATVNHVNSKTDTS